jgi:hypothetical protein
VELGVDAYKPAATAPRRSLRRWGRRRLVRLLLLGRRRRQAARLLRRRRRRAGRRPARRRHRPRRHAHRRRHAHGRAPAHGPRRERPRRRRHPCGRGKDRGGCWHALGRGAEVPACNSPSTDRAAWPARAAAHPLARPTPSPAGLTRRHERAAAPRRRHAGRRRVHARRKVHAGRRLLHAHGVHARRRAPEVHGRRRHAGRRVHARRRRAPGDLRERRRSERRVGGGQGGERRVGRRRRPFLANRHAALRRTPTGARRPGPSPEPHSRSGPVPFHPSAPRAAPTEPGGGMPGGGITGGGIPGGGIPGAKPVGPGGGPGGGSAPGGGAAPPSARCGCGAWRGPDANIVCGRLWAVCFARFCAASSRSAGVPWRSPAAGGAAGAGQHVRVRPSVFAPGDAGGSAHAKLLRRPCRPPRGRAGPNHLAAPAAQRLPLCPPPPAPSPQSEDRRKRRPPTASPRDSFLYA